jgi:hypothetical protein
MELIVTLAILALAGYWVYDLSQKQKKDADTKLDTWQPPQELTEKSADVSGSENRVESTAPKCGCGRSPTGFCVGLHKLSAEDWAVSDQNPNRVTEVAAVTADRKVKAVAKAKTAVKKTADKKPAAKRAPAKKKST